MLTEKVQYIKTIQIWGSTYQLSYIAKVSLIGEQGSQLKFAPMSIQFCV